MCPLPPEPPPTPSAAGGTVTLTLPQAMQRAFAAFQGDDMEGAERLCRAVLGAKADHFDALHLGAIIAVRTGRKQEALDLFTRAVAASPAQADAHNNRGNVLRDLGRHAEALASYDRAIALRPDHANALVNRGNVLRDLGQPARALLSVDRAIAVHPAHADAHFNRGNLLHELGRHAEALESYDRAIAFASGHPGAHYNRANVLRDLGRNAQALAGYERAIALKPDFAEAFNNRATTLKALGRTAEALESYDRAIAFKPDFADAFSNRGSVLGDLGRHDEALRSCDRAIALEPGHAGAWNNRGTALRALGRHSGALENYDRAIGMAPGFADAHFNRGTVLRDLRRPEEALESYGHALALKPGFAGACNGRGNSLHDLARHSLALESYDRALALEPGLADAWNNRGNVLQALDRRKEALASYDRALALDPALVDGWCNRGHLLRDLKRHAEALASYERARGIAPDHAYLQGSWLHVRMQVCDWDGIEDHFASLARRVARGEKAADPFVTLAMPVSPDLQGKAARTWASDRYPASRELGEFAHRASHDRLRIGYFSSDFRDHAVSHMMAEVFERHDRSRIELTAFSFGPDTGDAMRRRVSAAFERFIDVRGRSDAEAAGLARELAIDIGVDLSGFTHSARTGVFAHRAAPVQASYIGFPGSMGADYYDYLIADRVIVPEGSRSQYDEKIVYLPSYQANDSKRPVPERASSRESLGLPPSGFVFCCFNNNYKITPGTFDGWMRILGAVDGSVLFLYADNDLAPVNLRKEAARRGVDPARLVFGERLPLPDYLARYRAADLFLDTLPFNAGATASDALWSGLPVLTRLGEGFAGRMAGSLLTAVGLPELAVPTQEAYEASAVALANDPARLASIRQSLARNRRSAPLFDVGAFTRSLEAAFRAMHERQEAGLAPDHIHVSP